MLRNRSLARSSRLGVGEDIESRWYWRDRDRDLASIDEFEEWENSTDTRHNILEDEYDPDPLYAKRGLVHHVRVLLLPENSTDRFLTIGATALVSALLLQYLLFPGFGLAKRVLPLLIPAPVAAAFDYLVPDDIKQQVGKIPGAEKIEQLIARRTIDSPPTTTVPEVVGPSVTFAAPLGIDFSVPASDPFAPGDQMQRAGTISIDGPASNLRILMRATVEANSPAQGAFLASLQFSVDYCSVPWSAVSTSPQLFRCESTEPLPSALLNFNGNATQVATNVDTGARIYPRFTLVWPDLGPTSSAISGANLDLKLDFEAHTS